MKNDEELEIDNWEKVPCKNCGMKIWNLGLSKDYYDEHGIFCSDCCRNDYEREGR